jgi:4-amino-4-deoxy-L-arabinose transferase-like glycosyltransferase
MTTTEIAPGADYWPAPPAPVIPPAASSAGPARTPRFLNQRFALFGLLIGTALLYLVNLSVSGNGNEYYAAAVQAGTKSWKAFFFGSFDSSNFITVDKPPAFLWPMEIAGRIFGFNSWSMLVPQALMGVGSVWLLYLTVRRWFGPAAGFIAGAALALTPVAVLMFRFNDPDAMMTFLMVLAAYFVTRALEQARTKWMVLTGLTMGFAFLAKGLQPFTLVPALALVYLVCAPTGLFRRIWQTLLAGAALVAGCGWWLAIVALTPAADRPYIGGSTNNSALELAFGYNGLGRLTGNEVAGASGGGAAGGAPRSAARPESAGCSTRSWVVRSRGCCRAPSSASSRSSPSPDGPREPIEPEPPRSCGVAGCWSPERCSVTPAGSSTPTTRSSSPRRSPPWSGSRPWWPGGTGPTSTPASPWRSG